MEASTAVSHRAGGWGVVLWTTLGPLACTLIALGVNHRLFMGLDPLAYEAGLQSALILDADKFKLINDRFGHQAGDRALELIAETLRATVRAGDIVGRLGGEEFGVFLPNIDRLSAGRVAERLRMAVAGITFVADGHHHPLSVSIGGVVFDEKASFELLFQQADDRLYHAKQTGRNKVAMTSYIAEVAG